MACLVGSIKHLKDRKPTSVQWMKGYHSRAGFMVKLLKVDNPSFPYLLPTSADACHYETESLLEAMF
jgi:hypothetical protein